MFRYSLVLSLPRLLPAVAGAFLLAHAAQAAPAPSKDKESTEIVFSVSGSAPAVNDRVRTTVSAGAVHADPAEAAAQVNARLQKVLEAVKTASAVTALPPQIVTQPEQASSKSYGGKAAGGWSVRGEIALESRDPQALAVLIDKLQDEKLVIGRFDVAPATTTYAAARDRATEAALTAFRERAGRIAAQLGKNFQIRELDIAKESKLLPLDMDSSPPAPAASGGVTAVSVTVSGKIELLP